MSFQTQPALRMAHAPSANHKISHAPSGSIPAKATLHAQGQKSSHAPIGRSSRISDA
jgi:hypothetical protein